MIPLIGCILDISKGKSDANVSVMIFLEDIYNA